MSFLNLLNNTDQYALKCNSLECDNIIAASYSADSIETDQIDEKTLGAGIGIGAAFMSQAGSLNLPAGQNFTINGTNINATAVALTNKDLTSGTNTFPASLVDLNTAQALTNKDLSSGTNTFPWTIAFGDFTPTIVLQGGSAWTAAGITSNAAYIRIGNRVHCCVNIYIPGGTAGVGAALGLNVTALPIPVSGTLTCRGTCNAMVNNVAATNPATANGYCNATGVDIIGLNLVGYTGNNRAGVSADEHWVSASFIYNA